ncbi:hypothetical protein [Candidatus Mesenet endosymbiont of Agriotes lineatus]|uniref:hypothetical protein n=1 Tax=Candidatus Mesenet endosymbiont of Agriotes lineatus TaxID=3077948 RepID=UPI0030CE3A65
MFFLTIVNNYTEVNNCVREAAEEFKNNLVVQPVLKLDLSNHYNEIYEEVYNEIIKDYKLRIEEDQLIYPLYEGNESLAKKSSKLREGDNELQSILSCISREVVSKIKNEEFIVEVYDRLVDHVLDISSKDKNHPLHEECCNLGQDQVKKKIKEQVKENSDYRLLNGFMEYAVNRNNPSIHIISVLVANGASLLSSHINDPKTKKLITVKEYLLKLRGEYEALVNRSIFTIMRKVHKLVFDFPVIGEEGIDLLKVVSTVPSEEGCFEDSGKNVPLLNKIGGEGEREFMSLLKDCIENVRSQELDVLAPFFRDRSTEKHFEDAYTKLYDCIDIGYLAVATGDNKVIIDYISEIEEEAKQSRSPNLKKLYEKFLTILKEYNDLPKSMFLTRWWKYICRTVKSYTTEWSPAWEKILKGPGYPTDVTEWSQNKYKNIEKAEKEKKDARIEEAEARADEEKTRADQAETRAELERRIRKTFTREIRRLDDELGDIVEDNQDQIVDVVVNYAMEHRQHSPEPIVSTVMEEIKLNREQVIREGVISAGIIGTGIRSFLTDVNVESGCSSGMGRN